MGINIGQETSRLTVYKDEKGRYSTYIKGQELKDNEEKEDIYMSKKLQFKKGVKLKNKTVIDIIKGWNSCYRIKTDEINEQGKPKYKYFDKYFISEFNVLEEGTDEIKQSYKTKQEQKTKEEQNSFAFDYSSSDELPFQEVNYE